MLNERHLVRSIIILALLFLLSFDVLAASDESGLDERLMIEKPNDFGIDAFDINPNYSYKKIDEHAVNCPPSAEASIQSLAAYLVQPAKNEREKARSIFRWITENIDYNVEGLLAGDSGSMSLESLLKNRKSVCGGYSDIFQALAAEMGLEAVRISGYGKGYGYSAGENLSGPSNHAWNAVKINGSWHLVDCTWGAGYMNEDKRYIRKFEDHYFLTPSLEFIFDHFPENSSWQLLDDPISKSEFEQLVYVKSEFFKYGLRIENPLEGFIKTDKEINISVFAPEDILMVAKLEEANKEAPMPTEAFEDHVFWQRDENRYDFLAKFPDEGKYTLRLFAKQKDEPGEYPQVIEYAVLAKAGDKGSLGFPMNYSKFKESGSYLYFPMEKMLKSGSPCGFKVKVPGANNVSVVCGEKWSYLERKGDVFEGNVTPAKGDVMVYANFGRDKWDGLLKYEIF